jgi:hypothetical protein
MISTLGWFVKRDRVAHTIVFLFIGLALWWLFLQWLGLDSPSGYRDLVWGACYQLVALFGGLAGVIICRSWGSFKSVLGRAMLSFSLGLLLQSFGQSAFSFYNLVLEIDVPYPSVADIGFFGSIPFYIYGILLLAKLSGVRVSLRSYLHQMQAIFIPIAMLVFSYLFFLRGYEFDWSEPLKILLDFGYPLGQVVYVSIAILTYVLSKKVLGGIMRPRVLFLLLALVIQYIADYNFLFQALNGTWQNGGYGDFIYLLAYLFMALGLLQLRVRYITE